MISKYLLEHYFSNETTVVYTEFDEEGNATGVQEAADGSEVGLGAP